MDCFNQQTECHMLNLSRKLFRDFDPIGLKEDLQNMKFLDIINFWELQYSKPTKIINVSKNNNYKNPNTAPYTLEKVFATDCDILNDQNAIDEFNSYSAMKDQIKTKINLDFYRVFLFKLKDSDTKFMVIGIDNKKIEEKINALPNREFLFLACSISK